MRAEENAGTTDLLIAFYAPDANALEGWARQAESTEAQCLVHSAIALLHVKL
jgi:hypothetical protein